MPHATGRCGPTGETKVSLEKAGEIRSEVYIPEQIKTDSLRSSHPSCFNDYQKITNKLGNHFVAVDDITILSYVARV